ncbi:hypothetical protein Tco_1549921 [Tanacetum coccineum]
MLKHLLHELDEAQKALDLDTFNATIREDEAVYLQAFNDALNLDERFLRQKAKIEWLRSDQVLVAFIDHYMAFLGQ